MSYIGWLLNYITRFGYFKFQIFLFSIGFLIIFLATWADFSDYFVHGAYFFWMATLAFISIAVCIKRVSGNAAGKKQD